jgi:hypothetical protein
MRPFCLGLIVAALIGAAELRAELPQATLNWVFPPGARAGSTTEVTIAGSDLDEPGRLIFSDTRLSARAKPGTPNQFEVLVPDDFAETVVDLRFAGRFGVSNPRAFAVGRRPELIVPATNTSFASAFEVPLDTTVNARAVANNFLWFRFSASAGQRLIIRAEGRDLDSRLVPNLAVNDFDGRERAIARRREWLDFTVPMQGAYLLKVSDQTFRGGDDYHFRLLITTGPHVDFALPNILRAGESNRVAVFGRNLPGGQPAAFLGSDGTALEQLEVEILAPESPAIAALETLRKPAAASLLAELFSWRLPSTNGSSNPFLFLVSTNPVLSVRPNQLPEIVPPCDVSGVFPERSQLAGVTFKAKKGDVFWMELVADRLGFPSDPHSVVQRIRSTKGDHGQTLYADVVEVGDTDANLGDRELNTSTRDAAARFEAPRDGAYRVLVRDLFNLAEGRPRYPYILRLRRGSPDFRLVLLPMPPPRVGEDRKVHVLPATLRRHQTIALKVLAFREDGFNGEIDVTATNLPPGLSVGHCRIPAGKNTGALLLTAGDAGVVTDAAIIGTATIGSNKVIRSAALASVLWPVADFNNENAAARISRNPMISVIFAEAAPVSISPIETKPIEVAPEGKLPVSLSIVRRGEFQGAFNLRFAGHEALDKAREIAVPEKATNVTGEINLAETKLPAGTHTLWLRGTVAGKYRNNPEALTAAEAELQSAEKALASVSEADKAKAEERKKTAEAAKKAAEEKAKPRDITTVVYSQPFTVTVLPEKKPETQK